ncbi:PREDICTED: uncharacterized protein LOC106310640 [Brassica oleracea var. oleracea]|uniref:uncharacterized protein LOC106310640 n=1 Tax=Brassica oleracea var. oleracea TaxID=109376 RepID=UPI0006A6E9C1|nr:PREDICTED: uncharacterized protein LOC106310640 [Brassica oleracea var. oleracea]XP_013603318.1 PREDICTED: uncharacterized protein LOC106310640 [Brassica oleracea var. oleracea]
MKVLPGAIHFHRRMIDASLCLRRFASNSSHTFRDWQRDVTPVHSITVIKVLIASIYPLLRRFHFQYIPFLQVGASAAIYRCTWQTKSQKHGAEHDTEELESLKHHRIELKRLCLMCERIVKSEKLNESWLFPHMGYLLPEQFTLHVDYRSVIHFLFPKFRRTHLQDQ